jgi:hypothetical protein
MKLVHQELIGRLHGSIPGRHGRLGKPLVLKVTMICATEISTFLDRAFLGWVRHDSASPIYNRGHGS